MKAKLYDSKGSEKGNVELPKLFETSIREDIVSKYFEASKERQPYAPFKEAGKRHSASGTISHRRHEWKGHYGKGISRIPRKAMWRRGTQFYWIGAEVNMARGGRRAHPPRLIRTDKKINKKEIQFAIYSALAATTKPEFILQRYSSISKFEAAPFVVENLPMKMKELIVTLKKIFGNNYSVVIKEKVVRSGKGKGRGRKYKSSAGLLIIKSKDEKFKFKGLDVKSVDEIEIKDLYPLGRLVLYTKKALEELSKEGEKK